MIIGGSKKDVIKNIQKNILNNELNKKVETTDPVFTDEERDKYLKKFFEMRKLPTFQLESAIVYKEIDTIAAKINNSIEIKGLENLDNLEGGAIVTSNHFSPLENLVVRQAIKKRYKQNIYVVSQETNLALEGHLGYIINHVNLIPLAKSPNYIINTFKPMVKRILDEGNYVLIYPEEEMWLHYRKPRPCKRGAYEFAAENNKPVISCFIEILDTDKKDNDEFNQVKYVIHILKPIYPDKNKTVRQNSIEMKDIDYKQKVEAYEKAYNKKLDYTFSYDDIAGIKKEMFE